MALKLHLVYEDIRSETNEVYYDFTRVPGGGLLTQDLFGDLPMHITGTDFNNMMDRVVDVERRYRIFINIRMAKRDR